MTKEEIYRRTLVRLHGILRMREDDEPMAQMIEEALAGEPAWCARCDDPAHCSHLPHAETCLAGNG